MPNTLGKVSVSVLDVFPKEYAIVSPQNKEDSTTYLSTRVGCWTGSSVLVIKQFLRDAVGSAGASSFLERRNKSGDGETEIAYQKIASGGIDSCRPCGFGQRFAF